jgi:hypothetical protein
MRLIFVAFICSTLPFSVHSEGLWNKVKKGASNAGQAIENTANDVGNVASDVGNTVSDTIDSTAQMVSNEETPQLTRERIDGDAADILSQLFSENPDAKTLYDQSFGYAVFDARQVTVVGATAGYGRGVAVEKETGARTYMKMGTGGVGLAFGIGGFSRKFVILFKDSNLFYEFRDNGYDATAQAGTMFGDESETEKVQFINGLSIFVLTKKGWRVSATAAGTKYWKDAALN